MYSVNELWNLVPADRSFNQRHNRDRLPSVQAMNRALNLLAATYGHYQGSRSLERVLAQDVATRFTLLSPGGPASIAQVVAHYLLAVAEARDLPRF